MAQRAQTRAHRGLLLLGSISAAQSIGKELAMQALFTGGGTRDRSVRGMSDVRARLPVCTYGSKSHPLLQMYQAM